jgi:hypothetical protein
MEARGKGNTHSPDVDDPQNAARVDQMEDEEAPCIMRSPKGRRYNTRGSSKKSSRLSDFLTLGWDSSVSDDESNDDKDAKDEEWTPERNSKRKRDDTSDSDDKFDFRSRKKRPRLEEKEKAEILPFELPVMVGNHQFRIPSVSGLADFDLDLEHEAAPAAGHESHGFDAANRQEITSTGEIGSEPADIAETDVIEKKSAPSSRSSTGENSSKSVAQGHIFSQEVEESPEITSNDLSAVLRYDIAYEAASPKSIMFSYVLHSHLCGKEAPKDLCVYPTQIFKQYVAAMERKEDPEKVDLLQAPRTKGRFAFFICPLDRYDRAENCPPFVFHSFGNLRRSWVPILFDGKAREAIVCPSGGLSEVDMNKLEYLGKAIKSRFASYPGGDFTLTVVPAVPYESHVWSIYCLLIVLNYVREGASEDMANIFDLAFMPETDEAIRCRVLDEISAAKMARKPPM